MEQEIMIKLGALFFIVAIMALLLQFATELGRMLEKDRAYHDDKDARMQKELSAALVQSFVLLVEKKEGVI